MWLRHRGRPAQGLESGRVGRRLAGEDGSCLLSGCTRHKLRHVEPNAQSLIAPRSGAVGGPRIADIGIEDSCGRRAVRRECQPDDGRVLLSSPALPRQSWAEICSGANRKVTKTPEPFPGTPPRGAKFAVQLGAGRGYKRASCTVGRVRGRFGPWLLSLVEERKQRAGSLGGCVFNYLVPVFQSSRQASSFTCALRRGRELPAARQRPQCQSASKRLGGVDRCHSGCSMPLCLGQAPCLDESQISITRPK